MREEFVSHMNLCFVNVSLFCQNVVFLLWLLGMHNFYHLIFPCVSMFLYFACPPQSAVSKYGTLLFCFFLLLLDFLMV